MRKSIFYIIFFLMLFPSLLHAAAVGKEAPWEIKARILEYDAEKKVYRGEGDVILNRGNNYLYADKVTYNEVTGIAKLKGDIWFETPDEIMVGDEGEINLKKGTGFLKKSCIFIKNGNYYISGEKIEKVSKNTYIIEKCRVTTCNSEKPAWSLDSSKVEVTIDGYGKVKHAVFKVKGVPVFYIPYIAFSTKRGRQSGFLPPRAGYFARNGFEMEIPFYWNISEDTDATFYQRYFEKRGYMQGIELRHMGGENSKISLLADIISDDVGKKDMSDKDDIRISPYNRTNKTRYWFRGKADQMLPFDILARLDWDYISDQDYLLEFERGLFGFDARTDIEDDLKRPMDEIRSPTRRTSLRLSRDTDDYSLQLMSSYYERPEHIHNDDTSEPLTELYFHLLPKQFRTYPIFYELNTHYKYVWKDYGDTGSSFSINPSLRFPLWLKEKIEFEPYFKYNYTGQIIDKERGSNTYQSKVAYEAGTRLSSKLFRSYEVDWKGAKQLTHYMWPELTYRYRENSGDSKYRPWFEPIDSEPDVNLLNFTLRNFLDAKLVDERGNVSYRQWVNFVINQGYDFKGYGDDGDRHFTPLSMYLNATPFPELDLRGRFEWDHYDKEVNSGLLSANLHIPRERGRVDTYRLDYIYTRGVRESIDGYFDIYLAHGFSFGSDFSLEMRTDTTVSNSYWLTYESQCWAATLKLQRQDEQTSFGIGFHLLGLGDIRKVRP